MQAAFLYARYLVDGPGTIVQLGDSVNRILDIRKHAQGAFFGPTVSPHYLPLFIWLNAAAFRFLPTVAIRDLCLALNCGCTFAILALTYGIAAALFGETATAVLAAALVLFQPALLLNGLAVGSADALLQTLALAGVFFWLLFVKRGSYLDFFAAAGAFALASMTRYEGWFLVACFTILLTQHCLARERGALDCRSQALIAVGVGLAWAFIAGFIFYNTKAYFHSALGFLKEPIEQPLYPSALEGLRAFRWAVNSQGVPALAALAALGLSSRGRKDATTARLYLVFPVIFFTGYAFVMAYFRTNVFHTWLLAPLLAPLAANGIRRFLGSGGLKSIVILVACGLLLRDWLIQCDDEVLQIVPGYLMDVRQLESLQRQGAFSASDRILVELWPGGEGQDERTWSVTAIEGYFPGQVVFDRRPTYVAGPGQWSLQKDGNPSILDEPRVDLAVDLERLGVRAAVVREPASVIKLSRLARPVAAMGNERVFLLPRQRPQKRVQSARQFR